MLEKHGMHIFVDVLDDSNFDRNNYRFLPDVIKHIFSVHRGSSIRAEDEDSPKTLSEYISRTPFSFEGMSFHTIFHFNHLDFPYTLPSKLPSGF